MTIEELKELAGKFRDKIIGDLNSELAGLKGKDEHYGKS